MHNRTMLHKALCYKFGLFTDVCRQKRTTTQKHTHTTYTTVITHIIALITLESTSCYFCVLGQSFMIG